MSIGDQAMRRDLYYAFFVGVLLFLSACMLILKGDDSPLTLCSLGTFI
jgi:hypothetical protein